MSAEKVVKLLSELRSINHSNFAAGLLSETNFHRRYESFNQSHCEFNIKVLEPFCNLQGFFHGGALATLVDTLVSIHSMSEDSTPHFVLCTSCDINFISSALPGKILEIKTSLTKINQKLSTALINLSIDDKTIGIASQTLYTTDKLLKDLIPKDK